MTLNEYQELARTTTIYPDIFRMIYPALGLASEAGEVAGKVKKMIRDDNCVLTPERKADIVKECGDVLWYLSAVVGDMDMTLEEIARINLEKLLSRQERGVIGGSGDNR